MGREGGVHDSCRRSVGAERWRTGTAQETTGALRPTICVANANFHPKCWSSCCAIFRVEISSHAEPQLASSCRSINADLAQHAKQNKKATSSRELLHLGSSHCYCIHCLTSSVFTEWVSSPALLSFAAATGADRLRHRRVKMAPGKAAGKCPGTCPHPLLPVVKQASMRTTRSLSVQAEATC